jgi:hypothetical protein
MESYRHRSIPYLSVTIYQKLPWTKVERAVTVDGWDFQWGDWEGVAQQLVQAEKPWRRAARERMAREDRACTRPREA